MSPRRFGATTRPKPECIEVTVLHNKADADRLSDKCKYIGMLLPGNLSLNFIAVQRSARGEVVAVNRPAICIL